MSAGDQKILRIGVVIVWLSTAAIGLWEFNGQGMDLLLKAGIDDRSVACS